MHHNRLLFLVVIFLTLFWATPAHGDVKKIVKGLGALWDEMTEHEYNMVLEGEEYHVISKGTLLNIKSFVWRTVIEHLASGLEGSGSGLGEKGSFKHALEELWPKVDNWLKTKPTRGPPPASPGPHSPLPGADFGTLSAAELQEYDRMLSMIEACAASGTLSPEENIQLQAVVLDTAHHNTLLLALARFEASGGDTTTMATTLKAILLRSFTKLASSQDIV